MPLLMKVFLIYVYITLTQLTPNIIGLMYVDYEIYVHITLTQMTPNRVGPIYLDSGTLMTIAGNNKVKPTITKSLKEKAHQTPKHIEIQKQKHRDQDKPQLAPPPL